MPNQPGHLSEPEKTEVELSDGQDVPTCCGLTWLGVTGPQTKALVGTWLGGAALPDEQAAEELVQGEGQKSSQSLHRSPTVPAPLSAVAVLG